MQYQKFMMRIESLNFKQKTGGSFFVSVCLCVIGMVMVKGEQQTWNWKQKINRFSGRTGEGLIPFIDVFSMHQLMFMLHASM